VISSATPQAPASDVRHRRLLRAILRKLRPSREEQAVREAIEELIEETPRRYADQRRPARPLGHIPEAARQDVADVMVPGSTS